MDLQGGKSGRTACEEPGTYGRQVLGLQYADMVNSTSIRASPGGIERISWVANVDQLLVLTR